MQYSIPEFEEIYLRCFPPSMRLAVSMLHDEDEARDVVQEVFLRLWETETRPDNPLAFTVRSVRNACLNRIASLEAKNRLIRHLSLEPAVEEDTTGRIQPEDIRAVIDKLLTPRERQVVGKIYTEGLSYKASAEAIGVSVAMVNKSIVNALKKLRLHFKSNCP